MYGTLLLHSDGTLLIHSHDPWLGAISIMLAMIASYTALDLAGRVTAARGAARLNWLIGGAIVMGSGIWSMHFTAMLAFEVSIPILYDVPIVIISWVVAVIAAGLALFTVSRRKIGRLQLVISGLVMGFGIAAMHYIGMAAMRLQALLSYDPFYFSLSIIIAIVASMTALWLSITFRSDSSVDWNWAKAISAVVMGIAISGMHFTGMHAAILTLATDLVVDTSRAIDISTLGEAAIVLITIMVLGFTLVFSIVDQRLAIQAKQLESYVTDLQLVAEIGQIVSSLLDQQALVSEVVNQVQATFNYYGVHVYLMNEQKDALNLIGESVAHEMTVPTTQHTIPIDQGFVGRAVASNTVVLVPDVSQVHDPLPDKLLPETKSMAAVPITWRGDVFGVLAIQHTVVNDLQERDVHLIQLVADQVAVAIQNAHLFEQMAEAKEAADTANKAKSVFLSNMTHELRTPMNGVIGMTSLLFDTALNEHQYDIVNTIRTSGNSLLEIINDILDFSKIEANKLELEKVDFDLGGCIEEALEIVSIKADEKGLNLAYFLADQVPSQLNQDVTRVRQILVNLLSNAIKFTEKGEVIIYVDAESLSLNDYRLHFSVKDSGIGIPQDRLNRLFQSFSQIDSSTTRRFGGTGLGLAISKRLSELMQGAIWVESEVGVGSTFHFTIVAEEAKAEVQAAIPDISSLSGNHVLLIIENDTTRRFVREHLKAWGICSTAISSEQTVLTQLETDQSFTAIILDLQGREEIDGAALLADIQTSYPALPLMLLTTRGQSVPERQSSRLTVLSKPVRPSLLHDALATVIHGEWTSNLKPQPLPQFNDGMADQYPLKILLAEDNLVNQKVAIGILARHGYRADVAANGLEVLDALDRQRYDVVLMDINMPEMDGLTATRRICSQWQAAERPYIIAMTANAMQGDREQFLAAGMNDYISKPIGVETLIGALTRMSSTTDAAALMPEQVTDVAPALDTNVLAELEALIGETDPQIVTELITLFLEESPQLLDQLQNGANQADAAQLQKAAHTLKSSAASLGAIQLANLCDEVETQSRLGDITAAPVQVARIVNEYDRAKEGLSIELNKRSF